MNRVPSKHGNGAVYFRLAASETLSFEDYFRCLEIVKPLFERQNFKDSTPGFYINYIKSAPNGDNPGGSLRVVYFTTDTPKTVDAIERFIKENADKVHLFKSDGVHQNKNTPLGEVDDKSLRFWNCLSDSTKIFLDLLEKFGKEFIGTVVHKYLSQDLLVRRIPPKDFFEQFFSEHSNYYKKLKGASLADGYWKDLVFKFPDQPSIALHFPFNMVLGIYEYHFAEIDIYESITMRD